MSKSIEYAYVIERTNYEIEKQLKGLLPFTNIANGFNKLELLLVWIKMKAELLAIWA
jgi:hypothetical protein